MHNLSPLQLKVGYGVRLRNKRVLTSFLINPHGMIAGKQYIVKVMFISFALSG
jgi:hypothetical protein